MNETEIRDVLPAAGVWTVEDLAGYLNTQPTQLIEKLTANGIKILNLGNRNKLKLIRLEDLVPKHG